MSALDDLERATGRGTVRVKRLDPADMAKIGEPDHGVSRQSVPIRAAVASERPSAGASAVRRKARQRQLSVEEMADLRAEGARGIPRTIMRPRGVIRDHDPGLVKNLRQLWCAILMTGLRDAAKHAQTLGEAGRRMSGSAAERLEWSRAHDWIDHPDFAVVCTLAGFDPGGTRDRVRAALATPERVQAFLKALASAEPESKP